jgi:3-deoxy-D-arabino-heptulosonate 7-phosphate (DAHP) synthase
MSSYFRRSIASHVTAIALGAVATATYLTVHSASSQSLADSSQQSARSRLAPHLPRRLRTSPRMSAR